MNWWLTDIDFRLFKLAAFACVIGCVHDTRAADKRPEFALAEESSSATESSATVQAASDLLVTSGSGILDAPSPALDLSSPDGLTTLALQDKLFRWNNTSSQNGYAAQRLLSVAMQCNPNWGTFQANHAAAHAELLKACAFLNPEVEVEAGHERARRTGTGGSRSSSGVWSLAVSQPIEMPGKRLARQVEAQAGFSVVAGEAREFETALRADVMEAYWTVQYYTALERLHMSLRAIAEDFSKLAQTRVDVGEAGRIELTNARVELLKATRDKNAAGRRKMAARASLNALCGGTLGLEFELAGSLRTQAQSKPLKSLTDAALNCHPKLLRLAAELEQRYASLDRQRTQWWPDLKIGARQSREMDSDTAAIMLGIEVPLWNRNQGGIAEAAAKAQKTYNDIAIAFTEIRRDVEVAYYNQAAAQEQLDSFENGLHEAAEESVALAWEQYRLGAGTYLEVLNARKLYQETELGYLQAAYDVRLAEVRVQRASGLWPGQPSAESPTTKLPVRRSTQSTKARP
jgi:outer membrane protein, heavy metal efflux system